MRSERRYLLFVKIYRTNGGSAGKMNNLSGQAAERAQLIQVIQTTLEFMFRAPAAIARAVAATFAGHHASETPVARLRTTRAGFPATTV